MKSELGGVHHLITGLNGGGKTLYAVATILQHVPGSEIKVDGAEGVKRRLCVSGIKDLMLEHQVIDAPEVNPEKYEDKWRDLAREPGEPPLDVHQQVQNWWAWCMPGDVIVVDECQRVFRPFASGRRIPMYIEKLETARHYGVQFLYLTQGPALLHTNLRNLVGPHENVERVLGSARVIIRQWPVCTNPDKIKTATSRYWKHDKSAFKLYKSSQLHTKFSARIPLAVYALGLGLVLLVALAWSLQGRLFGKSHEAPSGANTPGGAAAPMSAPFAGAGMTSGRTTGARFTALAVGTVVKEREPYAGFGVHLAGSYQVEGLTRHLFALSIDGRVVSPLSMAQLNAAGYAWRSLGPCTGVLIFGDRERHVACDTPSSDQQQGQPQQSSSPARPGSAPTV